MKTRDILLVAGIGVLVWWLMKNKKKPLTKEDLSTNKNTNPTPTMATPTYVPSGKQPVTVDDLSKKASPVYVKKDLVMPELERPALREPIMVPANNLIPNIYDRGVGQPVGDQYYASFSGACSENIQSACKCASRKKEKYQLDIPKLP